MALPVQDFSFEPISSQTTLLWRLTLTSRSAPL